MLQCMRAKCRKASSGKLVARKPAQAADQRRHNRMCIVCASNLMFLAVNPLPSNRFKRVNRCDTLHVEHLAHRLLASKQDRHTHTHTSIADRASPRHRVVPPTTRAMRRSPSCSLHSLARPLLAQPSLGSAPPGLLALEGAPLPKSDRARLAVAAKPGATHELRP